MPRNSLLLFSRKVHLYFGLFISPALLFFAFTGAYQTLGLHEGASNYKPPALLAELGQLHKKQTTVTPVRRGPGPESNAGSPAHADGGEMRGPGRRPDGDHAGDVHAGTRPADAGQGDRGRQEGPTIGNNAAPSRGPQQAQTLQAKQKQHLPMKIFFLVVSLGLVTSTLTGMYMAYKYDRNKVLVTALLLAGVVVPLILLRF